MINIYSCDDVNFSLLKQGNLPKEDFIISYDSLASIKENRNILLEIIDNKMKFNNVQIQYIIIANENEKVKDICGTYHMSIFNKMIVENNIDYNKCYIVSRYYNAIKHMYNLMIFGKGQEEPTVNLEDENIQYIDTEDQHGDYEQLILYQKGVWYNLYVNDDEYAGTIICEDAGYEIQDKIPKIDIRYNWCTLIKINSNFILSLRTIMEKIILDSPEKTIYFLAHYQSYEKEVVKGIYTLEEFFEELSHDQIYANICYIINDL